ncbi:hypothetical protein [Providencia hangzhouensis]|uniref:hypothetical protein n=1 Tax=Providencia hangzhouensis TaxID=3031799 RepID=UPI0034DD9BC0
MSNTNSQTCIIKIASGPMTGQELMVNTDNNLIIISNGLSTNLTSMMMDLQLTKSLVMVLPVSFQLLRQVNLLKVVWQLD